MGSIPNLFQYSSSDEQACNFAMQLASVVVLPMTLKAAIELDVFEIIASAGPGAYLSPAEIASRLPAQHAGTPAMLDRMLSLLATYNVLTRSVEQEYYGIGPLGKFFTKNKEGLSVAPLVLMLNDKNTVAKWYHLKDVVMHGGTAFERAHGMSMLELCGKDPRFKMAFKEADRNHYAIVMNRFLDEYKGFEDVNVLVGVKGGSGDMLQLVRQKHPHVKGINYDLPHVISNAQAMPGVEHVAGDIFVKVPNGDAMFMKAILHNWTDENCVKLLKNCLKALPPNGKVLLMECCVPEDPENTIDAHHVLHQALNLMTMNAGKLRTVKELEHLAEEAGFSRTQAACSYCHTWLLELYK